MSKLNLTAWAHMNTPVIGMVHLRALPGSARFDGDLSEVKSAMQRDAEALVKNGVHGLMLENFGDAPFYPDSVPPAVISHLTALAAQLRLNFPDVPLGINVLRNDGRAALAIAHAVNAHFIRINVLCGARLTDQGIVNGNAHTVLRDRANLKASQVQIFADVNVKHSAALVDRDLGSEVADTIQRGLADAVILSGRRTGEPVSTTDLERARAAAGRTPLLVGSGATEQTARSLAGIADGLIVGTYFKREGVTTNPVDPERVKALLQQL